MLCSSICLYFGIGWGGGTQENPALLTIELLWVPDCFCTSPTRDHETPSKVNLRHADKKISCSYLKIASLHTVITYAFNCPGVAYISCRLHFSTAGEKKSAKFPWWSTKVIVNREGKETSDWYLHFYVLKLSAWGPHPLKSGKGGGSCSFHW